MVTYGGGLCGGDRCGLRCDVKAGATCVLATQSSTKIFKRRPRPGVMQPADTAGAAWCDVTSQKMSARVGAGAMLAVLPEPVACFKDANFLQEQVFEVEVGGTLVMLDWFTSGRRANGESWEFSSYNSVNCVRMRGTTVFHDNVLLANNELASVAERMGRAHIMGTLVMVGPRVASVVRMLLNRTMPPLVQHCFTRCRAISSPLDNSRPVAAGGAAEMAGLPFFFVSASPIGTSGDGVSIRIAAENTDEAYAFVHECLRPLQDQIGLSPFASLGC
jgi:urease accessory protein